MRCYSVAFAILVTFVTSAISATITCPASNGQTVTDSYNQQYVIGCGNVSTDCGRNNSERVSEKCTDSALLHQDTTTGSFGSSQASTSFNDCFSICTSAHARLEARANLSRVL